MTRAVRSHILSLKERDFIVICRVMGMSNFHIIFKELLPNITSYLSINFIMIMRGSFGASVDIMLLFGLHDSTLNQVTLLRVISFLIRLLIFSDAL
ncbi:hypothetical protein GCM10010916_39730 [Paenibacillus abyssi]|uniref:ABC transmembrane type-1 domain-containing protein n=1 Tax=Paenibacillus abyssi TaxID=1340531 RepID=A0A917G223_9BACL|nr:hypothetical protein GCM10010916_39730 [Paenibacillus abyssi]